MPALHEPLRLLRVRKVLRLLLAAGRIDKELWPPDQRMVRVRVLYGARDLCGRVASTSLRVASSEPDDAAPDWEIINDHVVALRAERSGSDDRVYTIYVKAVDVAGNESMKSATVSVRPPEQ